MMWFADVHDFVSMHGYALYVWPAWIVTAVVLLVQVMQARWERKRLLKNLWQQQYGASPLVGKNDGVES